MENFTKSARDKVDFLLGRGGIIIEQTDPSYILVELNKKIVKVDMFGRTTWGG